MRGRECGELPSSVLRPRTGFASSEKELLCAVEGVVGLTGALRPMMRSVTFAAATVM